MKIVMPCWLVNEGLVTLTQSAINSLRQTSKLPIIIIDNGSPMGGGLLRELADVYVRNKENLGYAKAVNQGLKLCEPGELVAVANNDIRVSPLWVETAEQAFQYQNVGSLHYRMLEYDQPFTEQGKGEIFFGGKERWCTSSFFVVRNVQLYDEHYFNSYDDWDFWKRMRQQGYLQAYTNQAEYQHKDSATQELIPNRNENDARNREYFKAKFGEYPEVLFEKEFPGELAKEWRPFP